MCVLAVSPVRVISDFLMSYHVPCAYDFMFRFPIRRQFPDLPCLSGQKPTQLLFQTLTKEVSRTPHVALPVFRLLTSETSSGVLTSSFLTALRIVLGEEISGSTQECLRNLSSLRFPIDCFDSVHFLVVACPFRVAFFRVYPWLTLLPSVRSKGWIVGRPVYRCWLT